jgi:hypothetical protein
MAKQKRKVNVADVLRAHYSGVGEPEMGARRFPVEKLTKKMRRHAITEKEFAELIAACADKFNEEATARLGYSYPSGFTHPVSAIGADGGGIWVAENRPDALARLKRLEGFPKWDIEETYA